MTDRHQPGADNHDVPEQWREQEFVNKWVDRDDGRQDERGPMIRATVAEATFEIDAPIRALDVGAGYGLLAKEVLSRYPKANVTLQDVSEPMFVHARQRLAGDAERTRFVNSDFSQRDWSAGLGGPFDLVVSAIAIHNMYDDNLISSIYRDIQDVTADGGLFLNLDYARQAGGVDMHVQWLKEAGFKEVEVVPQTERLVILKARK